MTITVSSANHPKGPESRASLHRRPHRVCVCCAQNHRTEHRAGGREKCIRVCRAWRCVGVRVRGEGPWRIGYRYRHGAVRPSPGPAAPAAGPLPPFIPSQTWIRGGGVSIASRGCGLPTLQGTAGISWGVYLLPGGARRRRGRKSCYRRRSGGQQRSPRSGIRPPDSFSISPAAPGVRHWLLAAPALLVLDRRRSPPYLVRLPRPACRGGVGAPGGGDLETPTN